MHACTTRHGDMNEFWRAVQSSALIDGEVGLRRRQRSNPSRRIFPSD